MNTVLAQLSTDFFFSCQLTTQPILVTRIGRNTPKRKPLTTTKDIGPAIQAPLGQCVNKG
jgi:hypothetical protein